MVKAVEKCACRSTQTLCVFIGIFCCGIKRCTVEEFDLVDSYIRS